MIVTLIGYRGTGKSSLARALAPRLGFGVEDSDARVQQRAGRSIADIFATQGEPAFRALERAAIVELLRGENIVLAAGGGAILDADTRHDIRAAGPVVWLRASVETIERRLAADAANRAQRPNLTSAGGRDEIVDLLARREPLYRECATLTVDTDRRSIDELAAEIAEQLERKAAP